MNPSSQPEIIPLWPHDAPGSEDWTQPEQVTDGSLLWDSAVCIRNVTQPTLTAYLPDPSIATGTAVIVCPGGAFLFLCFDKEGTDIAHWLNGQGIAAFVLKYRLLPTPPRDEDFIKLAQQTLADPQREREQRKQVERLAVADGQQAIRTVRGRATEWGLSPDRIGMLGFSAGGAVTAGVATRYDADSRPDFAAPIYCGPWQATDPKPDAPPLFLAVADDDPFAAQVTVPLYLSWNASGHSAEMHIYSKGGHGFALLKKGLPSDSWIDRFADWLGAQGLLQTELSW